MNTKHLVLALLTALLISCSDDYEDILLTQEPVSEHAQMRSASNNHSPWFDWESTDRIMIHSVNPAGFALLPWISGASAPIPDHVLQNYTRAEGWVMVYNNISRLEGSADKGDYLIFYNQFTGILRSFYYHTGSTVGSSSTTFWQLSLSAQTALLNSSTYFTKPMDTRSQDLQRLYVPNMTTAKGLSKGWNVFDVELTYDEILPTIPLKMNIAAESYTGFDIDIKGSSEFTSSGTIVTSTTAPNATNFLSNAKNNVAGGVGSAVSGFVRNSDIKAGTIKSLSNDALAALSGGITTELLKAGINLVFGSFMGKGNPTTTTQNARFTSSGTTTLIGKASSVTGSEASAISGLHVPGTQGSSTGTFIPSYNMPLGAWSIREQPVVKMSDATIWLDYGIPYEDIRIRPGYTSTWCAPQRKFHLDENSVKVVVNPAVLNEIDKHEVAVELVNYPKFQGKPRWGNEHANIQSSINELPIKGVVLLSSNETEIVRNPEIERKLQPMQIKNNFPGTVRYTPDPFSTNFVVKVTVTLYPKASLGYNTDPIVMTRSFLPKYQIFAEYESIKHKYPE
jgi:hypothetical protein